MLSKNILFELKPLEIKHNPSVVFLTDLKPTLFVTWPVILWDIDFELEN